MIINRIIIFLFMLSGNVSSAQNSICIKKVKILSIDTSILMNYVHLTGVCNNDTVKIISRRQATQPKFSIPIEENEQYHLILEQCSSLRLDNDEKLMPLVTQFVVDKEDGKSVMITDKNGFLYSSPNISGLFYKICTQL